MTQKRRPISKMILPFILLLTDVLFVYLAFFSESTSLVGKIIYFAMLELTLSVNIFLLVTAISGLQKSTDMFFKSSGSKLLWLLIFINFDFVVIASVFAALINLLFLLCLVLPLFHFLIFAMMWKYCNTDSDKIKPTDTNKYLGVGVNGHYVFDGVDILAEANHTITKISGIKLINPFNPQHSFVCENLLYVTGKDFKFYVATRQIDEIYSVIFFARNKDGLRYRLNKHKKEDFELNKNIFLAYGTTEKPSDDNFVYVENKLRYKITNINSEDAKSNVVIEQKTELPHLTSQNKISNWFGDNFNFASRKEADSFVKFVVEQTKNGILDGEY